jgi:two-component system, OmpR family, response regulator
MRLSHGLGHRHAVSTTLDPVPDWSCGFEPPGVPPMTSRPIPRISDTVDVPRPGRRGSLDRHGPYDPSMRALVVEDEVKMASLLRRGLEREGYAVDVAADGVDAVWYGTENDYDAIVLDVRIPPPDGFEVCRTLRARDRWAPILLLTARDAVEDRVVGLDAGADDYLSKPFSFAELAARLRALVRRSAPERPTVLDVAGLRLDPASRLVSRGGVDISLTPKEFALLETFMRTPGRVLTRTELLEHAWDFAYDGTSNVVDVYIGYLRGKVDQPFGCESIETVRGVGYRLLEA